MKECLRLMAFGHVEMSDRMKIASDSRWCRNIKLLLALGLGSWLYLVFK